ncbi:MAG: hypothetical protein ACLS48_04050 [[Eubacterium] siraeum]
MNGNTATNLCFIAKLELRGTIDAGERPPVKRLEIRKTKAMMMP